MAAAMASAMPVLPEVASIRCRPVDLAALLGTPDHADGRASFTEPAGLLPPACQHHCPALVRRRAGTRCRRTSGVRPMASSRSGKQGASVMVSHCGIVAGRRPRCIIRAPLIIRAGGSCRRRALVAESVDAERTQNPPPKGVPVRVRPGHQPSSKLSVCPRANRVGGTHLPPLSHCGRPCPASSCGAAFPPNRGAVLPVRAAVLAGAGSRCGRWAAGFSCPGGWSPTPSCTAASATCSSTCWPGCSAANWNACGARSSATSVVFGRQRAHRRLACSSRGRPADHSQAPPWALPAPCSACCCPSACCSPNRIIVPLFLPSR